MDTVRVQAEDAKKRFEEMSQLKKAKLALVGAGVCVFIFIIILVVYELSTTKTATVAKIPTVVFLESDPDDFLALSYLLKRPDYAVKALVVSGSGLSKSLYAARRNTERFLGLLQRNGDATVAAGIPVYYGLSFATASMQRWNPVNAAPLDAPLSTAVANLDPRLLNVTCSMSSVFVQGRNQYQADSWYGLFPTYLPKTLVPTKSPIDTDTLSPHMGLVTDVILPLQRAAANPADYSLGSGGIRAVVLGPVTDLNTVLKTVYRVFNATTAAELDAIGATASWRTTVAALPLKRLFADITVAGAAFGTNAAGNLEEYLPGVIDPKGVVLNPHSEGHIFFDAPSSKTVIEGGFGGGPRSTIVDNYHFAATSAPSLTIVANNAAQTAALTLSSYTTFFDTAAQGVSPTAPLSNSPFSLLAKALVTRRKEAAQTRPVPNYQVIDLTAPLDLVAVVTMTALTTVAPTPTSGNAEISTSNAKMFSDTSVVSSRVLDRVRVDATGDISLEGVTGKGTSTSSPKRSVVLGVYSAAMWNAASVFLKAMPNPAL